MRTAPSAAHTAAARPDEFPALSGSTAFPGASPSLLSRWAHSSAASALLHRPGTTDASAAAPAAPALIAARAPPPPPTLDAFPTLGGSGSGGSGRPLAPLPSATGWARVATAAPPPAPVPSMAASVVAAHATPRSYEAVPEDFPTLGGVVAVARASTATTIPRDRDELIARNKVMMGALAQAALQQGLPEAVADFRALSGRFQRGEVTSFAYFKQFQTLFGDATTRRVFPELVLLLPDQAKREELAKVFEAFDRSQPLLGQQPQPQAVGRNHGPGVATFGGRAAAGRGWAGGGPKI